MDNHFLKSLVIAGRFKSTHENYLRQMAKMALHCAQKLPVIFSTEEIKRLLKAPKLLRDRILLGIIYDTGLRISEAASLLIEDVDLDRQQLFVRQPKNKHDRYIPFSSHNTRGVGNYL